MIPWQICFGLALVVAVALVALVATMDKAHRRALWSTLLWVVLIVGGFLAVAIILFLARTPEVGR
jgi:Zn-dependent protease with chaperone function